jgi:hypothetical protein
VAGLSELLTRKGLIANTSDNGSPQGVGRLVR